MKVFRDTTQEQLSAEQNSLDWYLNLALDPASLLCFGGVTTACIVFERKAIKLFSLTLANNKCCHGSEDRIVCADGSPRIFIPFPVRS